jgi:cation diffusion facilitator CzcD-associated flavoprotein CzcO
LTHHVRLRMTDANAAAPDHTALLVIGAGPYGVAVAAYAQARGIATVVAGHPMALWRQHMPAGMFLRSSTDWHLDAEDVHTFAAFVEDRGIAAADIDPLPIAVFLDYTDWFIERSGLAIAQDMVTRLVRRGHGFEATLAKGRRLVADRVVAASGIARFQRLPAWAGEVPAHLQCHTCDFVDFAAVHDARLLIVGGRQSAYEWAALAADHGAARIDVVHRHAMPRFAPVSWAFVNPYIEQTLQTRGWWQGLPLERQQAISGEFWAAGRLRLDPWLTPRLPKDRVVRRPTHDAVPPGGYTPCSAQGNPACVRGPINDRLYPRPVPDRFLGSVGTRVGLCRGARQVVRRTPDRTSRHAGV